MNTSPNPIPSIASGERTCAAAQRRGCPPPTPEESQRRWAAWNQAMELSHEMLMAGLRQRIGPHGDLQAAYREWYERYQTLKWNNHRAT